MPRSNKRNRYCYAYPRPAVSADVIVFRIADEQLQILLIRRGREPFKDAWALPGGFVNIDEPPEDAARRELEEETGLTGVDIEQLQAFGGVHRDPRTRVISIAFLALLQPDQDNHGQTGRLRSERQTFRSPIRPGDDAADAAWYDVYRLPPLAFDHTEMVRYALQRLRDKLQYGNPAADLLGPRFTLPALQRACELIQNRPLDKRNFRRRILRTRQVEPTAAFVRQGAHRPARLYRCRRIRQESR